MWWAERAGQFREKEKKNESWQENSMNSDQYFVLLLFETLGRYVRFPASKNKSMMWK